jgi:recombination protein RecT
MAGGQVAKRTPMAEVCQTIASQEFGLKIRQALPPNVTLNRFTRTTLTAIQQNPELITADRQSLFNSVIRCAQDGLLPDGREAALVIFKTKGGLKCQYLPMVGGLRKVAAKHDFTLSAHVVHENDEFDYTLGANPTVTHRPPKLSKPRGEIIGAYAIATDEAGKMVLPPEVMSREEIESVRRVSRAATSEYGPWVNWFGEMARKTVARRLFKQLPLSDLDEQSAALMRAADAEYEFQPDKPPMSEEEANLSATLRAEAPSGDRGPDDRHEDIEDAEFAPVDEGQEPEESFEDRAERAQRARASKATE